MDRHIPPGTLLQKTSRISAVTVYRYSESFFEGKSVDAASIFDQLGSLNNESDGNCWIHIVGEPGNEELLKLGNTLFIHPLQLSAIQKNEIDARSEDHGEYIFSSVPFFDLKQNDQNDDLVLRIGGLFFFLFRNMLLTVSTVKENIFLPVIERLERSIGRIRKMNADYLLYALLDLTTGYFIEHIEVLRHKTELLEDSVLESSDPLSTVKKYRNSIRKIRQMLMPFRELLTKLKTTESDLLDDTLRIFYSDLLNHGQMLLNDLDSLMDRLRMIPDVYMSHLSNEMNRVMKVLTLIASIFIPLSFIAGVYGMNFKLMPELDSPLGYPITLGAMAVIAVGMVLFFKWKKWL